MPKAFKAILIVFLFFTCLFYHQSSFAWQSADSSDWADAPVADTSYDSQVDADAETGENEAVEAPPEAYNETNFDKASGAGNMATRKKLDDASWEKLTNDPAFQYDDVKEKEVKPKDYSGSWWVKMFVNIFEFFSSMIGKGVIISIVVLIVLLLIARAFQLNGRIFFSKKDKKLHLNEEHGDDYVPDNWEKEIADAAKAGNYRLALRHCYRYLLTSLQEKELIKYQVAKTNYQYVYELSGTNLHKPFMKLTRDYEYAWYGGFEINEDFYEGYYQMTQDIQKQLKNQ
jgi:hypothetical protein